jgi:hypothetical protein
MENIKLIFCEENSATELQVYFNNENKLFLQIDMNDGSYQPSYIVLDLDTSKSLFKHLKNEFSKIGIDIIENKKLTFK